jgi:hypothetical protein
VRQVALDLVPLHHDAQREPDATTQRAGLAHGADTWSPPRRDKPMDDSTDVTIDDLGPVDYLVLEFPAGAQHFSGETVEELVRLTEAGTIKVLDLLLLKKNEDGSVDAFEIDDIPGVDAIRAFEAEIAEILAEAMLPGSVAGVLVWENTWAAGFASAARRSGGQLIATGRIPIQAIAASMEAEMAAEKES